VCACTCTKIIFEPVQLSDFELACWGSHKSEIFKSNIFASKDKQIKPQPNLKMHCHMQFCIRWLVTLLGK
jgi:hypothetical protein